MSSLRILIAMLPILFAVASFFCKSIKKNGLNFTLLVVVLALLAPVVVCAQERGLRLPINGGPTYPGMGGLPSRNINDANFAGNAPALSGSPSQILQQNFPVQVKGSDADTFMPPALLERSLGPLAAPVKEIHL